jgi:hypothetical protein
VTRQEYFQRQRDLEKSQARAEARQAQLLRAAHREFFAPYIAAIRQGETPPAIDKAALAQRIEAIIRAESVKPAEEAATLHAEMEAYLLGKYGKTPDKIFNSGAPKYSDDDWKKMRAKYQAGTIDAAEWFRFEQAYYAERPEGTGRQSFQPEQRTGKIWARRASPHQGVTAYRKDPVTGRIIWDTTATALIFSKRHDLSASVWAAVEEEEQKIFTVLRTGRAMGRDVRDIAGDLEAFINYPDGGKRVMGRWGHMFPDTAKGREEGWKRQWLRDHPDPEHGPYQVLHRPLEPDEIDMAKRELEKPEAQEWVRQQMARTYRGKPVRPDVVREYHGRLDNPDIGRVGLDYRAVRYARTETAVALSERQKSIARNSNICTGKVDWILLPNRDGWNCKCAEYAAGGPYDVDDLPDSIPAHPNCDCQLLPHLKTDAQIKAEFDAATA